MHDQHGQAHNTRQQCEGIQQAKETAGVKGAHELIVVKGYSLKQIAEGHPENQGRYHATDEEAPVPGSAPPGILNFTSVIEANGPEEKGEQNQQDGPVKTRKGGGVGQGPGGKHCSAGGKKPDLVAFPGGSDGV